jgi:hypothetical protein
MLSVALTRAMTRSVTIELCQLVLSEVVCQKAYDAAQPDVFGS